MPSQSKSVSLSRDAYKRIRQNSKYVDNMYRERQEQPTPPQQVGTAVMMVVTGSSIAPFSGSTPGKGFGIMQSFNGTSYSNIGTTTYPIINNSDKTIASGAYVLCVPAYGYWQADVTQCSKLS